MKIRLGILCPIRRRIEPGKGETLESRISSLAGELERLGADVTLLAVEGSKGPGRLLAITPSPLGLKLAQAMAPFESMALCQAFSHAGKFDVILNFFGDAAIPFAILTGVVVIAGLDDPRFSNGKIQPDQAAREFLETARAALAKRENYRPWGHYENLAEGPDHKMKRITVQPGARLSLQKHEKRAERWIVISGQALVTLDDQEMALNPGDTVFIPKGAAHRVKNPGQQPLVFAEVQLGDYFGEDDIIRLQDDYGR